MIGSENLSIDPLTHWPYLCMLYIGDEIRPKGLLDFKPCNQDPEPEPISVLWNVMSGFFFTLLSELFMAYLDVPRS